MAEHLGLKLTAELHMGTILMNDIIIASLRSQGNFLSNGIISISNMIY
jgi:hypothetical protein